MAINLNQSSSVAKPKFSVVIPCYNEAKSLHELIMRCELAAKLGDGEFILVNNGSTDKTDQIFTELLSSNEYVKYVTVKNNQGYGFGITEGLKKSSGEIIGWTHADLQCDPNDVIRALEAITDSNKLYFVKGRRYGRPLSDRFFTAVMSIFESALLLTILRDINAQPTLFSRALYENWTVAPKDFSLDLFAFASAKKNKYKVVRVPVIFSNRKFGNSNWNVNFASKRKFIKRTLKFSIQMRKGIL